MQRKEISIKDLANDLLNIQKTIASDKYSIEQSTMDFRRNYSEYHFNNQPSPTFPEGHPITTGDFEKVINDNLSGVDQNVMDYIKKASHQDGFLHYAGDLKKALSIQGNLQNPPIWQKFQNRKDFIKNADKSVTIIDRYAFNECAYAGNPNTIIKAEKDKNSQKDRPIAISVTTSIIRPTKSGEIEHKLVSDKTIFVDPKAEELFKGINIGKIEYKYDKPIDIINNELDAEIARRVAEQQRLSVAAQPTSFFGRIGNSIRNFLKKHPIAATILAIAGIGLIVAGVFVATGGLAAIPVSVGGGILVAAAAKVAGFAAGLGIGASAAATIGTVTMTAVAGLAPAAVFSTGVGIGMGVVTIKLASSGSKNKVAPAPAEPERRSTPSPVGSRRGSTTGIVEAIESSPTAGRRTPIQTSSTVEAQHLLSPEEKEKMINQFKGDMFDLLQSELAPTNKKIESIDTLASAIQSHAEELLAEPEYQKSAPVLRELIAKGNLCERLAKDTKFDELREGSGKEPAPEEPTSPRSRPR